MLVLRYVAVLRSFRIYKLEDILRNSRVNLGLNIEHMKILSCDDAVVGEVPGSLPSLHCRDAAMASCFTGPGYRARKHGSKDMPSAITRHGILAVEQ